MQQPIAIKIQLVLNDSIQFFTRHIIQIASLCLPFFLLSVIFQYVLVQAYPDSATAGLAAKLFSMFVYPIYTAALIQFMARRARQEHPGNVELIISALPRWSALLMLNVVLAMMLLLGFSLFILPGIWIMVRMSFAEIYLVLFGMNPRDALEKSFKDTSDNFLLILAVLALTFVPFFLLVMFFVQLTVTTQPNALVLLSIMLGLFFMEIFVHIVVFRTFMEVAAGDKPERRPPFDNPSS